jgi:hypothetical protein
VVAEQKTLAELRRLVETGHIIALTPEQSATAVDAINFYSMVRAVGPLLVGVRNILLFLGSLIAIWWAGHDAIVDFILTVTAGRTP